MSDPLGKCLDEEKVILFLGKFEHKFGAKIVFYFNFCNRLRESEKRSKNNEAVGNPKIYEFKEMI